MKPKRSLLAAIAAATAMVWASAALAMPPIIRPLPPGTIVGPQWNGWENLAGSLASEPTCLAPAENRIECYASGSDGTLQRQEWTGARWTGWQTFPGVTIQHLDDRTGPSCFLDNARMTHCFVWGSDNALWHRWFPPGSNGWWENLGGGLTSSPSCTAAPDGRALDCFARGRDGAIWHRGFDGNTWGAWTGIGGRPASGSTPSCVARSGGRVDCVIIDAANVLVHGSFLGGTWRPIITEPVLPFTSLNCQRGGDDTVACYAPWMPVVVSGLRVLLESNGWDDRDLGANFGNPQGPIDLSCVDSALDRSTFECFALLPGQGLREFATSPAALGLTWRDVNPPIPPNANGAISRLSCVSWGPNRIDCFATSTQGGPMLHAWRTPNAAPARVRRGG